MPTPDSDNPSAPARWHLVVPLKPLEVAKSRLGRRPYDVLRPRLALAFALDTVAAALACPAVAGVLVVTDDEVAGAALRGLGAEVVPDLPAAGLNAAVRHGEALWRARLGRRPAGGATAAGQPTALPRDRSAAGATAGTAPPGGARPAAAWVAALSADLAALRAEELGRALALAAGHPRAFLADREGSGTTLLTAGPGRWLEPRFGTGSRALHEASGAVPLPVAGLDSVRRDVDTPDDLEQARRLGLGPRTAALLRDDPAPGSPGGARGRPHGGPRAGSPTGPGPGPERAPGPASGPPAAWSPGTP
ncbi:2-phospho-L-lactate guanylyltransferase [Allostreptomyces psammosilenae]|uniref:Phosphoenolpyruvate guanylyltransferase n=1 Tax=Allostreptomyces psammosilenae TaxID=1892865 RepID=A0A852ZWI9_9ACTN|nr:2-phospho-L-lactate guanylyltransferase [Allostreptomyces psammosilenae]NYI06579.1 2-phospho-L-lactate guanylyltransferase [Allostreptomyces psammosilenae]